MPAQLLAAQRALAALACECHFPVLSPLPAGGPPGTAVTCCMGGSPESSNARLPALDVRLQPSPEQTTPSVGIRSVSAALGASGAAGGEAD